jgi:hypothetical protein
MSSESMAVDLGKSAGELEGALNSVREMRGQWNEILWEITVFGLKVGISVSSYWKEKQMNLSLTHRRNYFKVIDMVASQLLTMQLLTTQLLTTVASQLLQKSDLICC